MHELLNKIGHSYVIGYWEKAFPAMYHRVPDPIWYYHGKVVSNFNNVALFNVSCK